MPESYSVRSLKNGAVDHVEVPTVAEAYLAALTRERDQYVQHGLAERAAEVQAEITRLSAPVSTEPGCSHPDCKLMHPHAGPAVLRNPEGAPNGTEQRQGSGRQAGRGSKR